MAFPTINDSSNNHKDATVYNSTSGSIVTDTSNINRAFNMLKTPYLVWQLDDTTMKINWQMSCTMSCVLSWGTSLSYSSGRIVTTENSDSADEHIHSYLLTNLIPGTVYYFKIEETFGGIYSSQFKTPDGSASNIKLFVISDTQGSPPKKLNTICKNILFKNSDLSHQFLFHVGDWSNTDSEEVLTSDFFNPDFIYANQARSSIPFIGVKGNHDNIDSAITYHKYWDFNYVSPFYYKFDNGPVSHFILDIYSSYSSGSVQYTWLSNSLAESTKPWKIIWVHEPMYCDDGGHSPNLTVRSALESLLVNNGVILVFSGHNHFYSRCYINNITHIVTGGAGSSLYSIKGTGTGLVLSSSNYHYLELDITSSELICTAYKWDDNSVIDSFTLSPPSPGTSTSTSTSTSTTTGTTTLTTTTTETTTTTTLTTTLTTTTTETTTTTTLTTTTTGTTTGTTTTSLPYSEVYSTYFSGTTQYGMAVDSRSFDFGRNAFGISFWMKANAGTPTIQALVSKINDINSSTGGKGWSVYLNVTGKLCIKVSDTAESTLTEYSINSVDYRDTLWHHIVINYDFTTSTASYFVDSVAQVSDVTTVFSGNFDSTHPFMVGLGWNKGATKDLPYQGYIDEISLHNNSISQERVTQMYNNGSPIDLSNDSSVKSWWRMGDSDVFPNIIDRGTGNNTLVLYNMTPESIIANVP